MMRRPRMTILVAARRHVVDGKTIVSLHIANTDQVMCVGEREWAVLRCADGTRDLDGITAAAASLGRSIRRDHLITFFDELEGMGVIADGVEPTDDELRYRDAGRGATAITEDELESRAKSPLDALGDYSFRCNGGGTCCYTFPTILFSNREVLDARTACPEVLDGGDREEQAFTPECGALLDGPASSRTVRAVATIDGRCAYLADDRQCSIHLRGGAESKPFGCRTFPLSFIDDGEAIRVSVAPVCTCVFTSLDTPDGASLIPKGARTGADLDPRIYVRRLPTQIAVTSSDSATRKEIVDWSRRMTKSLVESVLIENAPMMLWDLAEGVSRTGLNSCWQDVLDGSNSLEPNRLKPWLEALGSTASRRLARDRHLRSERALVVRSLAWIERSCERLLTDTESWRTPPSSTTKRDELLFLRMAFHGHHMIEGIPLVAALRDRAIRLLVGRVMQSVATSCQIESADHESLAHPLAIIESLMRGHGLQDYAISV